MRRAIALVFLVGALAGCSSTTNRFEVRDGNCYRIRDHRTMGVFHDHSEVLALLTNCGPQ